MSTPVTLNGITYTIPTVGETGWGQNTTAYLVALGSGGLLSLEGGNFPLSSELNVGPNFGIASPWYRSGEALPAQSGVLRLTNTEGIAWRDDTNSSDIALTVTGGVLTFNGLPVAGGANLPRTTVTGTSVTAVSGNMYILVNVAATTVTLPASPSEGNLVFVVPANGLYTNVIDPGAETIADVAGAMTLDNPAASVELQFLNASWRFIL